MYISETPLLLGFVFPPNERRASLLPFHWPSLHWLGICFNLLEPYIELCFVGLPTLGCPKEFLVLTGCSCVLQVVARLILTVNLGFVFIFLMRGG